MGLRAIVVAESLKKLQARFKQQDNCYLCDGRAVMADCEGCQFQTKGIEK